MGIFSLIILFGEVSFIIIVNVFLDCILQAILCTQVRMKHQKPCMVWHRKLPFLWELGSNIRQVPSIKHSK